MSTPAYAIVPSGFDTGSANFIAADGTAAKVVIEPQAAAVANPPAPLYSGGISVVDLTGSSSEASASRDVQLWAGEVLTTVGGATGTATTTTGAIVRTSGDFIADGWKPGELVMLFNATSAARQAVDGILGIITAVSTTQLTLNGTPLSALTLNAGVRIARMSPLFRQPIPAGSGTNGTAPSVPLLGAGLDGSAIRYERKLGAAELLAASLPVAVSALPAYVNVYAQFARY